MKKLSFNKQLNIAGNIVTFFYLCCILLFFCWVFSGCAQSVEEEKEVETKYESWGCYIEVLTVDNCEYVVAKAGSVKGGVAITHKQNCKFCAERLKHNNSLTLD